MNDLTMTTGLPALPDSTAARLRMLRQAAQRAQTDEWKPRPGETLAGVLVGVEEACGPYGDGKMLIVQDENGRLVVLWLTAWLRENLRAKGANMGDLLAITFKGKQRGQSGREFNAYDLIVEHVEGGS
jgi:hypothetical protein